MSNALYDWGRNEFLLGHISWDTDAIRVVMIDGLTSSYKHDTDQAADQDYADITAAGIVANSGADMTGKTPDGSGPEAGVADGADTTFEAVSQSNGQRGSEITIYKHTGTAADDTLLVNIDTATGLPVTPNGGDITVQWDSGANKIFKL